MQGVILIDISILRQFVELARTLNYRRTSEKLNLTQPTLSRNISMLEKYVGAALLVREQPLRLTAIGSLVLTHAGTIIAEEERMLAQAQALAHNDTPSLSMLETSDAPQLAAIMRELFARMHNDGHQIRIRMQSLYGKTLVEALQDGSIDLGYYHYVKADSNKANHLLEAGLDYHQVKGYENRLLIGIPRSNNLASRSRLLVADLAELEFQVAATAALEHFFISMRNACSQAGVELRIRLAATTSISDLLINGSDDCATCISTSYLNAGIVPPTTLEQLASFDVEDLDLDLCLNIVWKKDSKNPAIALLRSYL